MKLINMKQRKVLDRGFINLISQFGSDQDILKYSGRNYTTDVHATIQYLLDREPNVFKQVNFQFYVKVPKFVLNTWETSELGSIWRLLVTPNSRDYYIPPYFINKAKKELSEQECNALYTKFENFHQWIFNFVDKMMNRGVSYSQVKTILPDSQYVEFYWTIDLKSLMEFITFYYYDKHNIELKKYARTLLEIVSELLPITSVEFIKKELPNE